MVEKLRDTLFAFIDFLYAVVFGLILAETYDKIILSDAKTFIDKCNNILLVIVVFYYLCWDWLHARQLTLTNPYIGYRRFFLEVIIAFVAYGATINAVRAQVLFFGYILLEMLLGVLWAWWTLQEYPESENKHELAIIMRYEGVYSILGFMVLGYWYFVIGKVVRLQESIAFIIMAFLFLFLYDILLSQPRGLIGGPRTPFVSRNFIDKMKNLLFKKKGE